MPLMRSLMLLAMRFTTSSPFSDPSATSGLRIQGLGVEGWG